MYKLGAFHPTDLYGIEGRDEKISKLIRVADCETCIIIEANKTLISSVIENGDYKIHQSPPVGVGETTHEATILTRSHYEAIMSCRGFMGYTSCSCASIKLPSLKPFYITSVCFNHYLPERHIQKILFQLTSEWGLIIGSCLSERSKTPFGWTRYNFGDTLFLLCAPGLKLEDIEGIVYDNFIIGARFNIKLDTGIKAIELKSVPIIPNTYRKEINSMRITISDPIINKNNMVRLKLITPRTKRKITSIST